MDILRRCLPVRIRRALDELPATLDDTYESALRDIDEEIWEYAHRLFQCLVVSIRPLRAHELAEVLAVDLDQRPTPGFIAEQRPNDPVDAILSACRSLVTINNFDGSQVVQFAHFSVKEFLISSRLAAARNSTSRYHVLLPIAHRLLAEICLCILLQLGDVIDKNRVKNFPLADYAARHWVDHAQFEDVSSRICDSMKPLFDPSKSYFSAWIWIHNVDEELSRRHLLAERPSRPEATPLYYASLLGFHDLAEWLVTARQQDINTLGGFYQTPLSAASAKGHLHVSRLLMDRGAHVDTRDNWYWTPLHVACEEGHTDVVRLLIYRGADVDSQDNRKRTPLHRALQGGRLEVARLLLEHGANVNLQDGWNWTPLHWASEQGLLDVMQLLLERGADPDMRDNLKWTPLHWASKRGHEDVVRILLECGAFVGPQDDWDWTPLHVAAEEGHLRTVRSLLESGADPRVQDSDKCIPYQRALQGGYLEAARLLSERGGA